MTEQRRNPDTGMIAGGVVLIILGLAIFFWAKEHSPHMGFGQMLMRLDSWVFKPSVYNAVLVVCALLGLLGIASLVRGLQGNTGAVLKSELSHPPAAKTVCDNCGKSFPSHFYLERVSDENYFCEQCRKDAAPMTQKKVEKAADAGVGQPVAGAASASATRSIEQRLDRLKALFESNAINEQEYHERRSKLLDEI